ncbi:MAG: archease [Patescibacteria group bacterium]
MPYKIEERSVNTRMTIRSRTQEQLFTDAFLGMMYLLKPVQNFRQEKVEREISLESLDTPTLLTDFLNEVLSLSIKNNEFYTHLIFYNIKPTILRVRLSGFTLESFHREIRSIVCYEALLKREITEVWEAVLIFDVQ